MARDADHWRAWLAQHGAALLLFARQWSTSKADAEDAVQSGFLKFWQTRERARDEVAYLYSCVRSAAIDQSRSDQSRTRREQLSPPHEHSDFDLPIENADRTRAIETALRDLPADQREVIVMRIWGNLTFQQISSALDIPLQTAASRYRYAIKRLEIDLAREVGHG